MYVYLKSEPGLWTVGFYDPSGDWQPESDHTKQEEAANRAAFLNGQRSLAVEGPQVNVKEETYKHIFKVLTFMSRLAKDLMLRGIFHDASKLESPEAEIFDIYTPKLKSTTFGSDQYNQYLKEMKVALEHHYAKNSHHPQYFNNGIQGMTLLDMLEMLADWKAATLRHDDGDLLKSVEINKKRFGYSDELEQIFLNTIAYMGW